MCTSTIYDSRYTWWVLLQVFGSPKMEKQVNVLLEEKASVSSLVPRKFQLQVASCQLWVSRWVHKGEWKWNHVPGALSFTMSLPQRPSRSVPLSCSCCCTFQQTLLGSCHFVLSLSLSQSTSLLLLLSLCVRLMSNFNLACKAGGRKGVGEGAIPNGKQCKAVFSLLAHFESHVRSSLPPSSISLKCGHSPTNTHRQTRTQVRHIKVVRP